MITLGNNACIDITIGDYKLTNFQEFLGITIKEESGTVLPVFQLQLKLNSYILVPILRQTNSVVNFSYGPSADTSQTFEFSINNYNYKQSDGGYYIVFISGILNLKDFTNNTKIQFIEETSDKVLKSISSITPSVDYIGNDKQIWIQHNNTDKNFVERVLDHAFISEDDCVISAITIGKQLIVRSAKETFSGNPIVTFDNQNGFHYGDIKLESADSLFASFFSEGRKLPIIHIKERKQEMMESPTNSFNDGSSNSSITSNVNFPVVVDNGNCHDNYYKAWLTNNNFKTQLNRHHLILYLNNTYFDNEQLRLLDLVKISSSDFNHVSQGDPILGNYLLTEKITFIGANKYSTRLTLVRDFMTE